jgi:hypothetical protein
VRERRKRLRVGILRLATQAESRELAAEIRRQSPKERGERTIDEQRSARHAQKRASRVFSATHA